ncbi:hypothetical protein J2Z48_001453 [Croceifilum oryzae]|uniref:Uncharacterized protein n=1 Tax=Croceifilum oryzae TaxID=1553429 RepID=A0AAJ1WTS0_9BACL|nr:lipoprotein BA_5634 family protein [Croceifilum oryzae]MDQ0417281.1 hypothetical protein [Croceifilum oryzae]
MKKKMIWFLVVTIAFVGVGFGVKRYIEGPPQSVNGILVSGSKENIDAVKKLYKSETKQTADYQYKVVKVEEKQVDPNKGQPFYVVISKSTAKKFVEKGIMRKRQDPDSGMIVSDPLRELKELSSEDNLLFKRVATDQNIKLNDQMVSVKHIKHQAWIGYSPENVIILGDDLYNKVQAKEMDMSLVQFSKEKFDYKNKEDVKNLLKDIAKVYKNGYVYGVDSFKDSPDKDGLNMIDFVDVPK